MALFISGCGCTPDPDYITLLGLNFNKDKTNFKLNEPLSLYFTFNTSRNQSTTQTCLIYNKKELDPLYSDIIIEDSTALFCDRDLMIQNVLIKKNENILMYNFNHQFYISDVPNSKINNFYFLEPSKIDKSSINFNNKYKFTVRIRTNKQYLQDTIQIQFSE
jgi:hypothetical protein